MILLVTAALAGSVFGEVGEEADIGQGGTWARLFTTETGYHYFQGAGGDFWVSELDEELGGYTYDGRVQLTDSAKLQDTQVARCDDGGWLVVGSWTQESFDDSAAAWRVDASFEPEWKAVIADRDSEYAHNDMIALCSAAATGAGFAGQGPAAGAFFHLSNGELTGSSELPGNAMGGAIAVRDDGKLVAVDTNGPGSSYVRFYVLSAEFELEEQVQVEVTAGDRAYWPQHLEPFGDGWLLTYLSSAQGGPDGAAYMAAFDQDFNLVDSVLVSGADDRNGRPWFARRGDQVFVTYDRDLQPRVVPLSLDPDAVPADDDGVPDDDAGTGDSGDAAGDPDAPVNCGCASGPSGVGLLSVPAVWLLVRRRTARASPAV